MHELSIALGIVKIAEEECEKVKGNRVDNIELEIGQLSGIELESLKFVWPMATNDTKLDGGAYSVDYIRGKARCLECDESFEIDTLFASCPSCNSYFKDIIAGKELRVKALEIS